MTPRVFERTYEALKREVTSGAYVPGQRLQARALADVLGTSTTPVTDAMRQLLGEDVLEYSSQDGFLSPRVTVRRVHDLYDLSAWLTSHSVELIQAQATTQQQVTPAEDLIPVAEATFAALATLSQNIELSRLTANLNDRLRSCRQLEANLFDDLPSELARLVEAWNAGDWDRLRMALVQYHARRLDVVPQLVSLSYRERG